MDLLEQLHAEKSGRRRRGRARRREQVSRRQRARTSRSRGNARPAIYSASEQRAAARDSNSVTRKTYHVPKPATFHTHTDHTLLLTPTDLPASAEELTRFGGGTSTEEFKSHKKT